MALKELNHPSMLHDNSSRQANKQGCELTQPHAVEPVRAVPKIIQNPLGA